MDDLRQVFTRLLTRENAQALQYTASNGLPVLRDQIARRLTADGTPCSADNVLIIQGGQQGLDLCAKLVINAGDVVITENPTFLGALIAFNPTNLGTPRCGSMTAGWTWATSSRPSPPTHRRR